MNKNDELLRDTLTIAEDLEEHQYEHGCHPLAWKTSMVQQAHYDRVNKDARKTQARIRRMLEEGGKNELSCYGSRRR